MFKELVTAQNKSRVGEGVTNLLTENLIAKPESKKREQSFDRADQLSLQNGLLLLQKPEPKRKAAQKGVGKERTWPGLLRG